MPGSSANSDLIIGGSDHGRFAPLCHDCLLGLGAVASDGSVVVGSSDCTVYQLEGGCDSSSIHAVTIVTSYESDTVNGDLITACRAYRHALRKVDGKPMLYRFLSLPQGVILSKPTLRDLLTGL
jgi:hypothetical protein